MDSFDMLQAPASFVGIAFGCSRLSIHARRPVALVRDADIAKALLKGTIPLKNVRFLHCDLLDVLPCLTPLFSAAVAPI